ncbi:putative lipoprotein NlpE involved in copper resistance [Mesoflavibacter sabulilitoris]|uniref:DUF3124 domain-containing protein n=1 Tax=Mesoflavibacter zeaxanthinifaciens subsp. sabulilitoris TaxID=1520893 RepID=A0A2T1NH59_9FLAO|nr:DUF3124 domain-containing protein [Mesoflavibacter zeaxanthinifaciens]MBB3122729.1 putative lipoprotein NlpE involved in copper resistance [Mesoflavibacter zeaxanthinifaciens subsp. sabulilitoris]PSG92184.1 hypothetical protein C7H61_06300 [Mesoflavibacter zeaxanthinifaciens subsp. sabulilitoris]
MKNYLFLILLVFVVLGCNHKTENEALPSNNWQAMKWTESLSDSLVSGSTYLSVYSHIYSTTEHKTHDLTATVSIRNINKQDTIFVKNASYYDTKGNLIRTYFNSPIFVKPMQTIEIVIDEKDKSGGSGANFVFDWLVSKQSNKPYFEGVMITTYGQQGLSFTTRGIEIE